jgi:hypothetical protein
MSSSSQDNDHPLQNILVLNLELPLQWRALDAVPPVAELAQMNKANEKLLEVVLNADDNPLESEPQDNREIRQELRRIDAKINLLMEWMGTLFLKQHGVTERFPLDFSARGMAFSVPVQLNVSQMLQMDLYLEPMFPQPLKLIGSALKVEQQGDQWLVLAEFVELTDHVQALLEKYVFRIHRRLIAQAKNKNVQYQ